MVMLFWLIMHNQAMNHYNSISPMQEVCNYVTVIKSAIILVSYNSLFYNYNYVFMYFMRKTPLHPKLLHLPLYQVMRYAPVVAGYDWSGALCVASNWWTVALIHIPHSQKDQEHPHIYKLCIPSTTHLTQWYEWHGYFARKPGQVAAVLAFNTLNKELL